MKEDNKGKHSVKFTHLFNLTLTTAVDGRSVDHHHHHNSGLRRPE